jgi:hypothetical protein
MKWAAAQLYKLLTPVCSRRAVARIRELRGRSYFDLGLTPQALCLRLLRRLFCKAVFIRENLCRHVSPLQGFRLVLWKRLCRRFDPVW